MSDQLKYLLYRIDGDTQIGFVDYLGFDASGKCVIHAKKEEKPTTEVCDLVIPGAWLTAHTFMLPAVSKKQRDLLLTQVLEDRILVKLSDLHWLASPTIDGKTTVWVIEKNRLTAIADWVKASGVRFQRWLPEPLFLTSDFCYAHSTKGIIFRAKEEFAWLECEADLLALYPDYSFKEIAATQWIRPSSETVSFYQTPKVSYATSWNDWRIAIYILISALIIYLLSLFIQWRSLANQEAVLRQEIRQTFASIFPGVPVVDPILQWQSQQNAISSNTNTGDALDLLQKTAAQIDLELGVDSVEVKAGKVSFLLDEGKAAALLAKLTAQGTRVQSHKTPDGRMSVEVLP